MSQMQPLTDAEQDEKCDLECIPCQGLTMTTAQAARYDELSQRGKVPRPLPPGTPPKTVRIPKMTTMIAGDSGVGGAPIA